ncbi:MAG: radical SAM protein [Armatimonadota bacterium]|nr:radical SAM protein [Armatimonadota bacterium]
MLQRYSLNGEEIDSLDLKFLLITSGINIPAQQIYERFGATHRANVTDPTACECFLLSDGVVVLIYPNATSPFTMGIAETGRAYIAHEGRFLTEIDFPPHTEFYEQRTSQGRPFAQFSVLPAPDLLTFPYLWPCDHAQAGFACQFCYPGRESQRLAAEGKPEPASPTPHEVGEVVDFVFNVEQFGSDVIITGGTKKDARAECPLCVQTLVAIDEVAGLENIPGEILVYTSAPSDHTALDAVFEAGADRVAIDLEVYDQELFQRVCPGKAPFTSHETQLGALEYVVESYGRGRACSTFVVGVEPLESLLAGVDYIASRGIVPLLPVLSHTNPAMAMMGELPQLDYYRRVLEAYAEAYDKYDLQPPSRGQWGPCLCGDARRHRKEILA